VSDPGKPQNLPPFTALRAFEAAARHLSFSKAAEELHVTSAAISHQIKGLEDFLDVQVFRRLNRGLELTEVGKAGLPKLHEGFDCLTDAVLKMRGQAKNAGLTVAATPSFASKWLVPRLQRFAADHSDIDLRISAGMNFIDGGNSDDPSDIFRNSDIDIAIQFGKGVYPGCRVDKLFSVSAAPLCSPRLLKGKYPLRTPEDLRHHTLLHDDTVYEGRPDWSAWLELAGVEGVDVLRGVHFNHVSLALESAIDGQGVVFSLLPLAAGDINAKRLVIPFDLILPLPYSYYVISPEATAYQAEIATFREWLLKEAGQDAEKVLAAYSEATEAA